MVRIVEIINPITGETRNREVPSGTKASQLGTGVFVNGILAAPDHVLTDGQTAIVNRPVEDPISLSIIALAYVVGTAAASFIVGAAVGAGWTYLGWKAVEWVVQSSMPAFDNGTSPGSNSQTYGWNGIRSTSDVDLPIPIIYGTHRVGGNYVNAFATQQNEDQYMNVLIALGEGEMQEIAGYTEDTDLADIDVIGDGILIDGNPISNFREAQVYIRMGADVQTVIPYFGNLHDLVAFNNVLLEKDVETIRTTEGGELSAVEIHFQHSGLSSFSTEGVESQKVRVDVYYREHEGDSDTWIFHGTYTKSGKTQSRVDGIYRIDALTPGKYDIRLIKRTKDSQLGERATDTYLAAFDEITDEALTYPNTALLGLRLLATSQLSGTLGDVSVLVKGRKVRQYFLSGSGSGEESGSDYTYDTGWSDNPMWCILDFLMSDRYGLGLPESSINIPRVIEMAAYADEEVQSDFLDPHKRFQLDFVLDSDYRGFEAATTMAGTCRAFLVWTDGKVDIVIEKPEDVSAVFGMGNIIKGSFRKSFLPATNKLNACEMQFMDQDNDYERDTVFVYSSEAQAQQEPLNKNRSFLRGVTRRAQAIRMANFIIKQSRGVIRTVEIGVALDALTVKAGDVIGIAHDVPAYGLCSGRVKSATTNTVVLTKNLTLPALESGQSYVIKVWNPDGTVEEKTILSPDDATYPVGDSISVDSNWAVIPTAYKTKFSIGTASTVVTPFRVVSISRNMDGTGTIRAIEYVESAYDDTDAALDIQTHTLLPDPTAAPQHVTELTASSHRSYYPVVEVAWRIITPTSGYGFHNGTVIYVSEDGGENYRQVGSTRRNTLTVTGLKPLKTYLFKAVAVNGRGLAAPDTTAPTYSFTPEPGTPANITGLEIKGQGNVTDFNTVDCTFAWRPVASASAIFPAGEEPAGAGSGSEDEFIKGYRCNVYVQDEPDPDVSGTSSVVYEPTSWHLVTSRFVRSTEISYLLSSNTFDNGGTPRRRFALGVRAVDVFGAMSENENILSVYNPPYSVGNIVQWQGTSGGESAVDGTLVIGYTDITDLGVSVAIGYNSFEDNEDFLGYAIHSTPNGTWLNSDLNPVFVTGATEEFGRENKLGMFPKSGVYFIPFSAGREWSLTPGYFGIAPVDAYGVGTTNAAELGTSIFDERLFE